MAESKFKPAVRKRAKLRLGLTGPTGSGKTYSALLIASGMGGSIGMIDTEHGSGSLYDDLCNYEVAELGAPFTPQRYIDLINEGAEKYDVLIIDSLTHAWTGAGGVLDMHGKATSDSRSKNSYAAWRTVTPKHNLLVETILQSPAHIICTMRSKMAYSLEEGDSGKGTVRPLGLQPVQRDGMVYEFTTVFDISVEHVATATKDRTGLFAIDDPFTPDQETGLKILQWLESGEPVPDPVYLSLEELKAEAAEQKTIPALQEWYHSVSASEAKLSEANRKKFRAEVTRLRQEMMKQGQES
jgi:hypothetical protein